MRAPSCLLLFDFVAASLLVAEDSPGCDEVALGLSDLLDFEGGVLLLGFVVEELLELLEFAGLLVVDELFGEFVDAFGSVEVVAFSPDAPVRIRCALRPVLSVVDGVDAAGSFVPGVVVVADVPVRAGSLVGAVVVFVVVEFAGAAVVVLCVVRAFVESAGSVASVVVLVRETFTALMSTPKC